MTDMTPTLPPLPSPAHPTHAIGPLWNAEQMQSYATAYGAECARAAVADEVRKLQSLLGAALGALRYHTEQTRPIQRTKETITAIERELAATPPAVEARDEWVLVPKEIIDRFPEINPSNYDHDDACALNAWGVELVLSADPAAPGPQAVAETGWQDKIKALADEYAAKCSEFARSLAMKNPDDSMSPVASAAGDARMALHEAIDNTQQAQQASAQPTQAAKDVLLFLLGEAQLNGYGFGEKPEGVGNYWWRKHLRASFENWLRASNTGQEKS